MTGGCLCGAIRYEASGAPSSMGFCCCADCRKASGAGFIPFMNFSSTQLSFSGTGTPREFRSPSLRGTEAVRNFCPACGSLVFGGELGKDDSHTIYAGSLDDPRDFRPTMAIFARECPPWAPLPDGLVLYDALPD